MTASVLRPLLPLLHLLVVGLLLCSQPLLCAAQASMHDIVITSITSPNCTADGPYAVDCLLPLTMSVHTAGLPVDPLAGDTYGSYYLLIRYAGVLSTSCWGKRDLSDPSNSSVVCTLRLPGLVLPALGVMLNVSFRDWTSLQESLPFVGLSLANRGPPLLTSISGCASSNGSGTFGCAPDVDVLQLRGSNMLWFAGVQTDYVFTSIASRLSFMGSVTALNDSYAELLLNVGYSLLLLVPHYNGTVLPLAFNLGYYPLSGDTSLVPVLTNSVSISFIPLPPPIITFVSFSSCAVTVENGTQQFNSCLPGVSSVSVTGHYLYGSVSVGNSTLGYFPAQLTFDYQSPLNQQASLPYIAAAEPGVQYDVMVSNDAGSTLLPAAFTYTAQPTLAGVDACLDSGSDYYYPPANCPPGATLLLRGFNFIDDPQLTVLLTPVYADGNVSCTNASFLSPLTITCTLPSPALALQPLFYGQQSFVTVLFPSSPLNRSNTLMLAVYVSATAAIVTSVTGCGNSSGALSLTECRSLDVLTLAGSNLGNASLVWATNQGFPCLPLDGSNTASALQCQLPDLDSSEQDILTDTPYTMQVNTRQGQTNIFRISFTSQPAVVPQPPASGSPSSSSGRSAAVVAAAVVVPVVVVLALLSVLLWRRHGSRLLKQCPDALMHRHQSDVSSDDMMSSAVELES